MNGASDVNLSLLAEACDLATFGRNEEDVYDETYRKAGKLDRKHFAIGFDPESSGLMTTLRTMLLEGHDSTSKSIRCELYKLNVYGELYTIQYRSHMI